MSQRRESQLSPPSVIVDEARGKLHVFYTQPWYGDRCDDCDELTEFVLERGRGAVCELMEAEKPCKVTGERYGDDVKNGIET